jgi:hypothetical protein
MERPKETGRNSIILSTACSWQVAAITTPAQAMQFGMAISFLKRVVRVIVRLKDRTELGMDLISRDGVQDYPHYPHLRNIESCKW